MLRLVNTGPNEANQLGKIVSKNITAVMNPSACLDIKMNTINNKLLIAIMALSVPCTLLADTIEDGRYWFAVATQGKLPAQNWGWMFDVNQRYRNEGANADSFFTRIGISYQINPKTSLGLGFDHVVNHPVGRQAIDENRLWQQVAYRFDPILGINLASRTRLEQRWREGGDDTSYRLRQMIRATIPLAINPKLSVVAFDELFINLNKTDWGVNRGNDQNRVFLGVNWAFTPSTSIETGYLNQYVNTRNIDGVNHVLSSTLRLNF